MHTPERDEFCMPIFGSSRTDKLSKQQSIKTENSVEDTSHTYSMKQERMTTVRDATVHNNTVTSPVVAKATVHGSNETIVFNNAVPDNILNE